MRFESIFKQNPLCAVKRGETLLYIRLAHDLPVTLTNRIKCPRTECLQIIGHIINLFNHLFRKRHLQVNSNGRKALNEECRALICGWLL